MATRPSSIASSIRNSIPLGQQRHQRDGSRDARKQLIVSSVLREMARTANNANDDEDNILNKINFSNIQEIRSNSFQVKDFLELMKDGKQRLRSFQTGNWSYDVDPVEMAEAGFYYLMVQDRVQCVFCEIVLDNWHAEDDPLIEHARHNPRCNFISGYDVKNIPVRSDPVRGPGRRLPNYDVAGNMDLNSRSSDGDEVMSSSGDTDEDEEPLSGSASSSQESTWSLPTPSLRSFRKGPVHKPYVTFGSRLRTFENPQWPRDCPIAPADLAAAGFFYLGPFMGQRDSVKCYHCDSGLCQWEPDDDPWKEHKRVSPDCEFIELNFPIDGEKARHMDTQGIAEEWMSTKVVQEFLRVNKCSKNTLRNVLSQRWLKYGIPFKSVKELKEAIDLNDPLSKLLRKNEHNPSEANAVTVVNNKSNNGYLSSWSQQSSQLSSSQGSQASSSSGISSQGSSCIGSEYCEEMRSRERLTCKVCWVDEIGCIIRPCNHLATCTKCGPALTNCPICRVKIEAVDKVFF